MATKYNHKPISHFEQMHNPALRRKVKISRIVRDVLSREQVVDESTGRVFYKSSYVVKDNSKTLSKFKVSDFALENLIAVDALKTMNPVHLSNGVFEAIDSLENSFSNIEKSIKTE